MRKLTVTCVLAVVLHALHVHGIIFKIGLLTYYGQCCTNFAGELSHSAISIAVDDLVKDGVLPHGNFSIVWRDSRTAAVGIGSVVDFVRDEHVDVIFGSPLSAVTVYAAHLTSHWNMPHISWVAISPDLSNKDIYTTYVRTLGPFSKIGIAFVGFFQQFQWQRAGLLFWNSGICKYAMDGIRESFYGSDVSVVQSVTYWNTDVTDKQMDTYLNLLKWSSRIIILCDDINMRRYMIRACLNGMCNGEYLFLWPWVVASRTFDEEKAWKLGDDDDAAAKHAYRYLLKMTIAPYNDEATGLQLERFYQEVLERMAEPPWNDDYGLRNNLSSTPYSPFLYDAMYFYGLWLNYSTDHGIDMHDGHAMLNFSKGLTFHGITGPCVFDTNGDRIPIYWIWDFTHEEGYPRIAAVADTRVNKIETEGWKGFHWMTHDGRPPTDVPECGFYNELCPVISKDNTATIVGICLVLLAVLAAVVVISYIIRKRQIEVNMMKMLWKVDINDIELQKSKMAVGSVVHSKIFKSRSVASSKSDQSTENLLDDRILTTIGLYKGQTVVIKSLPPIRFNLIRDDLIELKEMREMQNDNINPFIGACLDSPTPCALFLYCRKGSLQDILENDDINLDLIFKYSLMIDLIQGMCYLHSSKLGSHGRLKSNNCLVDNRWVLKVTDYGMGRFLRHVDTDTLGEQQKYKSMLWTAPELLNMEEPPRNGTKEGDVYSFSIILHEIFYRMGPFSGNSEMTLKDLIDKVKARASIPCRPVICVSTLDVTKAIMRLMKLCWADNGCERPTFSTIRSYVKQNIKGVNKNIVDIMLQRLEKYACNLEELVDQRTMQLMEEKRKTDSLLYRMLPESVAIKLKTGESVHPELYESATVFFSDIVGFTGIASQSSPMEVVDVLNDLYTHFDEIIERYDAYKVETIGDAYLVVSGIPKRNGDLHAGVVADMSLEILTGLRGFRIRHLPQQRLMVRIGMHTGPCCAGVVGLSMPRYCLFGDTVNTASRMESNGEQQRIHISECSYRALQNLGGYYMEFRDEMQIKGKGLMRTFWLDGKDGFVLAMPTLVE